MTTANPKAVFICSFIFAVLWFGSVLSLAKSVIFVGFVYAVTGGWEYVHVAFSTVWRDLRGLIRLIQIKIYIWQCQKKNATVPQLFQELYEKFPDKVCFYSNDKAWTFKDVEEYSNRVANCFAELGYMRGEEVALFMESKPEYVGIWLGLAKIGVITALINTNLRNLPLSHSISVINTKAIIVGSELSDALKEIIPILREKSSIQIYCLGKFDPTDFPARSFDVLIQESSPQNPVINGHKGNFTDRLFYVYTSGTTGLPKAAIIKHSRYAWMAAGVHYMFRVKSSDVIYDCLPLYHMAGGILGVGQAILFGSTLVLRHRFSASKFWEDCAKYQCTVAQYIGELCRYLLAQPERKEETQHLVTKIFGNGLRPQIWARFQERFGIKQVCELYGSTEGNANVVNLDNKVGAIGFVSRIAPFVYPVTLIKVDELTGEPIRNKRGLCIQCGPGEPGEFVGKIQVQDPVRSFDGYVNEAATKKKIAKDVFRKGDMAFLSGDILIMDKYGYLYFKDRTGDTYRWRGENVSTSEVEGIISKIVGLSDCVVFGMEIPGTEGKAGMAAIMDPEQTLNLEEFITELRKSVPGYAIPIFIRVVKELETTGTYKLKKLELQKEGYNPMVIKDPLFYLNVSTFKYLPLDEEVYDRIREGKMKF